jgi:hypothetical protein
MSSTKPGWASSSRCGSAMGCSVVIIASARALAIDTANASGAAAVL